MDDLVKRDDLYFEKFTDVPFPGEVSGKVSGKFKNGKKEDFWNLYSKNGRLINESEFKSGAWCRIWSDGAFKKYDRP